MVVTILLRRVIAPLRAQGVELNLQQLPRPASVQLSQGCSHLYRKNVTSKKRAVKQIIPLQTVLLFASRA
jgi:hypothetical protein